MVGVGSQQVKRGIVREATLLEWIFVLGLEIFMNNNGIYDRGG